MQPLPVDINIRWLLEHDNQYKMMEIKNALFDMDMKKDEQYFC